LFACYLRITRAGECGLATLRGQLSAEHLDEWCGEGATTDGVPTLRILRKYLRNMRNKRPLDALLPRTRQGILAATLLQPEKAWYVSELARRMGVPPSSLQRELHELSRAGILEVRRQGRMSYYQANVDSPLFPEMRGLLLKTAGLVDVLADALQPVAGKLVAAFVYGSMASGREQSDSDIDLMIIGTVPPEDLALSLRRARNLLGREINPTTCTATEFNRKRAAQDPFLTEVLNKPSYSYWARKMSWAALLDEKRVTALAASKAELDNLRSIVARTSRSCAPSCSCASCSPPTRNSPSALMSSRPTWRRSSPRTPKPSPPCLRDSPAPNPTRPKRRPIGFTADIEDPS
jgi:DNA-binding transcriptional ArsR family regulator